MAAGFVAFASVLSRRILGFPPRDTFQAALGETPPPAEGQVLATFSGLEHHFPVTRTGDGYLLEAVSVFGRHEVGCSPDLDATVRAAALLTKQGRSRRTADDLQWARARLSPGGRPAPD